MNKNDSKQPIGLDFNPILPTKKSKPCRTFSLSGETLQHLKYLSDEYCLSQSKFLERLIQIAFDLENYRTPENMQTRLTLLEEYETITLPIHKVTKQALVKTLEKSGTMAVAEWLTELLNYKILSKNYSFNNLKFTGLINVYTKNLKQLKQLLAVQEQEENKKVRE